jgi:hypothetical protein
MGLFGYLFGSKPGAVALRDPPAAVSIDALEEVKDRIVAACQTRADWSQHARQQIAGRAKEIFYMMLAARDLLQAMSLAKSDLENISILIAKASTAEEELALLLDSLGPDARDLRRDLDKAFAPTRDDIRARLSRYEG